MGSNPTPSVSRRSRVETFRWDEERSSSAEHRSPPATNPTPSVSRRSRVETFRWDEERSSSAKHGSPWATNPTPSVSRRSWLEDVAPPSPAAGLTKVSGFERWVDRDVCLGVICAPLRLHRDFPTDYRAGTARSTLTDVWCLILRVSDRRRRRFRYSLGSLFLVAGGWGNHAHGQVRYLFRYEPERLRPS